MSCCPLIIAFPPLYVGHAYIPVRIQTGTDSYRMMEEVENGISVRHTYHSSDELTRLGKNFNQMLSGSKSLSARFTRSRKSLKLELKALQAQIQPHFSGYIIP